MKRQTHLRKILTVSVTAALSFSILTGCTRQKPDSQNPEAQQSDASEEPDSQDSQSPGSPEIPYTLQFYESLSQFVDTGKWETTISSQSLFDEEGNPALININTEIFLPPLSEMPLVEVSEPDFNEAFKERIAKTLCPGVEICYYDARHAPKERLEKLIESADNHLLSERESLKRPSISSGEDEWLRQTILGYEKMLEDYKEWLPSAGDAYLPVTDYSADSYRVIWQGVPYILSFRHPDQEHYGYISFPGNRKEVFFAPEEESPSRLYPYESIDLSGKTEEDFPEDFQLAKKQADDLLSKMGYPNLILTSASICCPEDNPSEKAGYRFKYGWGVFGQTFQEITGRFPMAEDYRLDTFDPAYPCYNEIIFTFAKDGLVECTISNPLEVQSETPPARYLSFDSVKEVLCHELAANTEAIAGSSSYRRFTRMDLVYIRLKNEQQPGNYTFTPTWRLKTSASNFMNPVYLNALDGSVIDPIPQLIK